MKTMATDERAVHKDIHVATLLHARRVRHDNQAHARLMNLARSARLYFAQMRGLG